MGNGPDPQPQQIQAQTQGRCQGQHPEALMGSQAEGTPKPQPSFATGILLRGLPSSFGVPVPF